MRQKSAARWTDDGVQPLLSIYAKDETEARISARTTGELDKAKYRLRGAEAKLKP